MPGPTNEHLRIARRLHFQGLTEEAIREYEKVLEAEPDNQDALSGLRALGADPNLPAVSPAPEAEERPSGLKTDFFVKQAREGEASPVKAAAFRLFVLALAAASAVGLYYLVTYLMHYDAAQASDNVTIDFDRPLIKDGEGRVNVEVINTNPCPIKNIQIEYKLLDRSGASIKEDVVTIKGSVPAGDRRTFEQVKLGSVTAAPAKLSGHVLTLVPGKRYKLKPKLVPKFVQAARLKDKEAEYYYEELVQEADDFPPAYIGMGRACVARSKFDKALDWYRKALELDPESASAHYYTGIALYYKGDMDGAKKEIDLAADLAPDDPEIAWNQKVLFAMRDPHRRIEQQRAGSGKGKAKSSGPALPSSKDTKGTRPK